jgi:hypothetical protein
MNHGQINLTNIAASASVILKVPLPTLYSNQKLQNPQLQLKQFQDAYQKGKCYCLGNKLNKLPSRHFGTMLQME